MSSNLRIDVHAHLLPGLDDGSRDVAESIALARRMVEAGYETLVCTPHIWAGQEYTIGFVADRVAKLQTDLDQAGVGLKLYAGGELNVDTSLRRFDSMRDVPTYAGLGKHALFDFWDDELPPHFLRWIEQLQESGITPILAHPERIPAIQHQPDLLDELAEVGLLFQGNLQCFSDPPTSRTRRLVERFLKEGRYFMLGSDLHRTETLGVRLDGLTIAKQLADEATIDRLTRINPSSLLPA